MRASGAVLGYDNLHEIRRIAKGILGTSVPSGVHPSRV